MIRAQQTLRGWTSSLRSARETRSIYSYPIDSTNIYLNLPYLSFFHFVSSASYESAFIAHSIHFSAIATTFVHSTPGSLHTINAYLILVRRRLWANFKNNIGITQFPISRLTLTMRGLFFTNIFIYKPHIKTFIHVYKLFIITNNTNNNCWSQTKTSRYRTWFPANTRPEPVLTSVGALFPALGHQH